MTAFGKPPRVLVTGGAGFIGSHVADRYVAEGCEVTVVDDLSSGKRSQVPDGARFVEARIESADFEDVFDGGRFDVINHHAAQVDVRVSVADPARDARINVLGLLNLLEYTRRDGATRFVYISSGGVVYGEPEETPTPETHPLRPLSPYGVAKLAGELYLYYYATVHGLDYAALRYGNVYGPRQNPHGEAGVIAIFSARVLEQRPVTIFGDGSQERDYVHVSDVVEANWLASTRPLPPMENIATRAWNIATGRGTSVRTLARRLAEISGREVEVIDAPARAGELERSVLDPTKAERELGWKPEVDLDAGLEETMTHIAEQVGRTLRSEPK